MSAKRIVLLLVLFICSLSLLFAEEVNPNLNYSFTFHLGHSVNANSDYHFEIWDTSNRKISSVNLSSGTHNIGSFVVTFSGSITIPHIYAIFEALTSIEANDQGVYDCYPFSMYVYEPGSTIVVDNPIATDLLTVEGKRHTVGTIEFSNMAFQKQYSYMDWDSRKIADFTIVLDDEEVRPGTYSGNVVISTEGP